VDVLHVLCVHSNRVGEGIPLRGLRIGDLQLGLQEREPPSVWAAIISIIRPPIMAIAIRSLDVSPSSPIFIMPGCPLGIDWAVIFGAALAGWCGSDWAKAGAATKSVAIMINIFRIAVMKRLPSVSVQRMSLAAIHCVDLDQGLSLGAGR
jgi:hypothetical protein